MAGIGFQLQKLIEDESFLKKAKAYIFASIITSGPWILSIICLGLIGLLSGLFTPGTQFSTVSITIVYTFAFSLILTGPVQFILTRYLADMEYLKKKEKMLSGLFSGLILSTLIALSVSLPWYFLYGEGSVFLRVTSILLFVTVCSIWTMMDFLSCSKNYTGIIASFFIGSALALILSPVMGKFYGTEGALAGYTGGQMLILLSLLFFIVREFPFHGFLNRDFFRYIYLYPYILFTGLFYNLGLWSDKLLGWYFYGEKIFGNFRGYNLYDTPVFLAYLIIIPSLAYFLIQSETRFYLAHRKFFDSITEEPLGNILDYKKNLISILKDSIRKLFLIQFISSSIAFGFAPFIGKWFGLQPESIIILRILFFAAGFQVMFLYIIIFLMYFDLSKYSFTLVFIFFLLNASLNLLFILYPVVPMGTGYLLSVLLSFTAGLLLLLVSVSDIEYTIFMRQEN